MVRGSYLPMHSNPQFNHTREPPGVIDVSPKGSKSKQDVAPIFCRFIHRRISYLRLMRLKASQVQMHAYNQHSTSLPVQLCNQTTDTHDHHERASAGLKFTPTSSTSAGLDPSTTSINPPPQTCLKASLTDPVLGCIPTSNT